MKDYDLLKEYLNYNPETGLFTWIKNSSQLKLQGNIAGHIQNDGYRILTVKGKRYTANRVAFYFVHGWLPEMVDHINRNTSDDRIENLRASTRVTNQYNRAVNQNSKTGIKGVIRHKQTGKWMVRIWCEGKRLHVGLFEDFFEACCACISKRNELHKEFARVN